MLADATQFDTIIRIRKLRLHGIVGALPHERHVPQPIIVDAELHCRQLPACQSDDLTDTVDYAALCDTFADIVASTQDQLLERLATRLLEAAFADSRVVRARVTVAKPQAITNTETVEVERFATRQEISS